jgi:hypothetical protein
VTLAAMAALMALIAGRLGEKGAPTEATAPRDAGEPIMAIVSIKSQQVTFYDARRFRDFLATYSPLFSMITTERRQVQAT